jgi:hypothetical protein
MEKVDPDVQTVDIHWSYWSCDLLDDEGRVTGYGNYNSRATTREEVQEVFFGFLVASIHNLQIEVNELREKLDSKESNQS